MEKKGPWMKMEMTWSHDDNASSGVRIMISIQP
jgi:hypothetical protein